MEFNQALDCQALCKETPTHSNPDIHRTEQHTSKEYASYPFLQQQSCCWRRSLKDGNSEEFFVQDGTVEYFNDSLVVLSTSAINIKDLSKEFVDNLDKDTQTKLEDKNITDHDRYVLNHKLDVLKEIRVQFKLKEVNCSFIFL